MIWYYLCRCSGPLPVAAKVDRRCARHRQLNDPVDLLTVTGGAIILTPGRFLGVANKIRTGDVMVMSKFAAPQTGEEGFGAIGTGAIDAVPVLMVDPPHGEAGVQRVPGGALIGVNSGALCDPLTDDCDGIGPPPSHYGMRICNVASVLKAWPNRFRYDFLPPGNRRTGAEMDWSLGTFGDLRLDKGGVQSPNGWSRARRYACAVWAVAGVAKSKRAGSSPTKR